ncbi:P-loop containing nucleoside triphosphate hydrolase [Fusarium acutatum]|uniref:P-loop containing nucleoside triphosphate hydrolase n=1 Tax=Fusarium acutatum TaxID=78861 RepID=A0A8H4N942_9HYPO|nr:P-loop containing nucleoside triphosphate hydrolase [Fusarium acutatum]
MADRVSSSPEYAISHAITIQGRKQYVSTNNRRKKVLRACDRCRVRKTKCDGFPPCRRCRRDGFVCTTENAAKNDFRRLSPGCTEVFEQTHSAVKAAIQSLYLMVRNGEAWDFDEPEVDDRGELKVHDIVHKLGYSLPCTEAKPPAPPMALEEEAMSKENASQQKRQIEDQILKEEAIVGDAGLLTPCQDEQSPPQQYVESFTDSSKSSIDDNVGSDTLSILAQQWANGFYTDLSAPILGPDLMALHWPQSDSMSEATSESVSANIPLLFQPAVFNMPTANTLDFQLDWNSRLERAELLTLVHMRASLSDRFNYCIFYNITKIPVLAVFRCFFEALREASARSAPPTLGSQLCLSNDADGAAAEGEYMEIMSKDLNNAIEAVKEADTQQNSIDESLLLGWNREHNMVAPYLHFYHTRNLLRDHVPQLPERQSQHINLLLDYLDKEFSPEYQQAERLLLRDGLVSKKHFHKLFGPREIIFTVEEGNHIAMVSKYPPLPGSNPIRLECEMWKFNGRFAKSKRIVTMPWPQHAAEMDKVPIKSLGIFPLRFDEQVEHRLRRRGKLFWKLRKPRLILYNAPSQVLDYRMKNGRVTTIGSHRVSLTSCWQLYPSSTTNNIWLRITRQDVALVFLTSINEEDHADSTFTGKLVVDYAADIVWNEDLFDKLLIPEGKSILRALLPGNKASVDAEAERDRGRLILFRGEPGTDKTLAAEAFARLARKPLYRLTPYEVGIELPQVENNIKEAFYLGDVWGAGIVPILTLLDTDFGFS